MKPLKYSVLPFFILFVTNLWATETDTSLFSYDKNRVDIEFRGLSNLEKFINQNPQASDEELLIAYPDLNKMRALYGYALQDNLELSKKGNLPAFWFCFILSAIGTYTIYGIVAGPIAVGIVYYSSDKSKTETKKAIWGCVSGTLVGAGAYYVLHYL
jgi:hypothetical protein